MITNIKGPKKSSPVSTKTTHQSPLGYEIVRVLSPIVEQILETEMQLQRSKSGRILTGSFETMGELLRSERKAQSLTLEALCDLCGVSKATLQRIETSKDLTELSSTLQNIALIARALGVGLSLR